MSQKEDLKKKEEEFNNQISEKKSEMQPFSEKLDSLMKRLNEINQKLGIAKVEGKQKKAIEEKKKVALKAEEIREKLKRGEKLTTEDILVLQRDES